MSTLTLHTSGANVIKLFCLFFTNVHNKLECVPGKLFRPILMFASNKLECLSLESFFSLV